MNPIKVAASLLLASSLSIPSVKIADASVNDYQMVTISAYCDEGIMADGNWTAWGDAAGAYWLPIGSLVYVQGYGTVVIQDRGQAGLFTIDLSMPGDCHAAVWFGREHRSIRVIRWGW